MQEGKVVDWAGFTNSWEKRRSKKQREKERYTQLNAQFQRITRGDNKSILNEQCKEVKQNNRMRKTSDLFKKTGDIKGPFHARMGTIKDKNGKDLTEAEEI